MLTQGGSDGQGQDKDGWRNRYSKGGWVSASAFVVSSASYSLLCLFLVIFGYLSVQHEKIRRAAAEGPTSRAPVAKVVKGSDTGPTDPHFDKRKVEEENRKQNNLRHQTALLSVLEEYALEPNKNPKLDPKRLLIRILKKCGV